VADGCHDSQAPARGRN